MTRGPSSGPLPDRPDLKPGSPIPREPRPWFTGLLARHSYLYGHLRVWRRVAALRAGTDPSIEFHRGELVIFAPGGADELARLLPQTRAALSALRQSVRSRGDDLVVSIAQPSVVVDPEQAAASFPLFGLEHEPASLRGPGRALLALLDELDIAACDPTEALADSAASGEPPHFVFDGHWNAVGHQVVAQELVACEALQQVASLGSPTTRDRSGP